MPSAGNNGKAKNWVFTLNNYTDDELNAIKGWADENEIAAIVGREVGQNGTPHLQGYIQVPRRMRLAQLKRALPGLDRAHLEIARGTPQANVEYCTKDDQTPIRIGNLELRGQGRRSDLEALHQSLKEGATLRSLCDQHFGSFMRYQRGITAARNVYVTPRTWETINICYVGPTGAGKTRAVFDNIPNLESIYVHSGGPWFDGYDGQPIVLFDDFGGSEFKLTYLLKLMDRYPMSVPVKGGFVAWKPREIYFTSNREVVDWFPRAHSEHTDALLRRFHNIVNF